MQPQLPSDFMLGSHVEDNSQREETRVSTRLVAMQISTLKAVQKRHDQNQKQLRDYNSFNQRDQYE